jgi:hypothetical protein
MAVVVQVVLSQSVLDEIQDSELAHEKKRFISLGKFEMPDAPLGNRAHTTHTTHDTHDTHPTHYHETADICWAQQARMCTS